MYHLHLQGHESMNWLIHLTVRAVHIFQTLGRNYPVTRCYNQTDLVPHNHAVETSNHCPHCVKIIFIYDYFICLFYFVLLMHAGVSMKEWNNKSFQNICKSISIRICKLNIINIEHKASIKLVHLSTIYEIVQARSTRRLSA